MNFDEAKYKILTWKSFMMLHWTINPGLFINEMIFGQRVPKIMLFERDSKRSYVGRNFIPCPHCQTIHPELKWSAQNGTAFNNWFGLYCDHCGKIIPCLWNLTSLVFLIATFPLWYWFKDRWKEKWLERQREKFSRPINLRMSDTKWWAVGLRFAVGYFIIERSITYFLMQEDFIWKKLVGHIIGSLISGLIFGYAFKKMMLKKSSKSKNAGAHEALSN